MARLENSTDYLAFTLEPGNGMSIVYGECGPAVNILAGP